MNYVSCRKNGDDVDNFSTGLLTSVDGGPFSAYDPTRSWLKTAPVMVHGYNTDFVNVTDAYRSNAVMMSETGMLVPTGFLWPGLGRTKLEALQFHKAQDHAKEAGSLLAFFLSNHLSQRPVGNANLLVITHSLGALVALEAARLGAKIDTLALTGPAVAADCFEKVYAQTLHDNIGRVLVYYSNRDSVLGFDFKVDQFAEALGSVGPKGGDIGKIRAFDRSAAVPTHNDYRHDRGIWTSIKENQL